MQPLTHHEIIALVEPFARSARHVDLTASRRSERVLVFKPIDRAGPLPLSETLILENPSADWYRLVRELRPVAAGPEAAVPGEAAPAARLTMAGRDPAELLRCIDAVPPPRHFPHFLHVGEPADVIAALSFNLELPAARRRDRDQPPQLVLAEAVARVGGITLTMRVPRVRGIAADIEIDASSKALPEDLLAVIGWDWAPMRWSRGAWRSKIRLRGREPRRSAGAEAKLGRTLAHLSQTLALPPQAFHQRHLWARWGVVFRRGIPVLTVALTLIGALLLPRLELYELSPLRWFAFHVPTLLLAIAFTMQELPRFEFPPLPRRLRLASWRDAEPSAAG